MGIREVLTGFGERIRRKTKCQFEYERACTDSWIKIDQLDVTRFIISPFTTQHVSNVSTSIFRSSRLTVDLFHVLYYTGSICVGVTVWFGWVVWYPYAGWSTSASACIIISPFTAQHVSNVSTSIFRSSRLTVDLFRVLYCSGSMCVGVTVWFGWGGVVSLYRLKH